MTRTSTAINRLVSDVLSQLGVKEDMVYISMPITSLFVVSNETPIGCWTFGWSQVVTEGLKQ